jgi:hypothetical protein
MNLIERAKNMLLSPKTEWNVVAAEVPDSNKIVMGYLVPLTIVGAIAAFIGYAFVGASGFGIEIKGMEWGIYAALEKLVLGIASAYLTAFVVDMLAPSFNSEKNMGRSLQLVVYGYTPSLVAALFAIIPALGGIMMLIGGIYTLYLLYIGFTPIKKTPEDKKPIYFIVCIVVLIVIYFIISKILTAILLPALGLSYGY